jgi:RNA polymerase sigma-70 factor (ECF subfamily)
LLCQEEIIRGLLSDRARLLAFIRSIVLSPHIAEDIHQDVVVQALQKASTIENGAHLNAWTRHVAKMRAFAYLRKSGRQPKHLDPDILDLLEPEWEVEDRSDISGKSIALNDCLESLTPRARSLINLRFTKRMSGQQMSQQLGVKIASVYMALSRIYKTLDECVRRKSIQS